MKLAVLNSGSSSIKYKLFRMEDLFLVAFGIVDRIGEGGSALRHQFRHGEGEFQRDEVVKDVADHQRGLRTIVAELRRSGVMKRPREELGGVAHRVVHGGEAFSAPVVIDDAVVAAIRRNSELAPLHNPASLIAIEAARARMPAVPQVAVFDTAFHQTMPPHAFHYAVPAELYERFGVRRYGFHGPSHSYVSRVAAQVLARPLAELRMISLHLGNGASAAAIQGGRSLDTSMGMTPLEGLVMGTRSGDVDPGVVLYLAGQRGMDAHKIEDQLNHEGGLKGLCGAGDMREVLRRADAGDASAALALDIYVYRIRKYIGAYVAVLGGLDALIFTGGVGENAAEVRRRCCEGLDHLGIVLDPLRNAEAAGPAAELQDRASRVRILRVHTDEEYEIARQAIRCLKESE